MIMICKMYIIYLS